MNTQWNIEDPQETDRNPNLIIKAPISFELFRPLSPEELLSELEPNYEKPYISLLRSGRYEPGAPNGPK